MSESIGKAEKFVNTQLKNSNALSNESQRKIEKTKKTYVYTPESY